MRLGIDGSNLTSGGSITHLRELLQVAEPERFGITRVVLWGSRETLCRVSHEPWLELCHEPLLDGELPARLFWQSARLPRLSGKRCDALFIPRGGSAGSFGPVITMSRNMLPFNRAEARRHGISWQRLRLELLQRTQTRDFRRADGTIFLTQYARRAVTRQIGETRGRIVVIPHGVCDRFRLAPRAQRPPYAYSEYEPFRLLYVSIIDLYKRQPQVVEAVGMLRREGMPVELTLVGPARSSALRELRATMARVDPGQSFVYYRGPLSHGELAQCYHQSDGFVFASSCENMPNILLEAMAGGLPIACSDRGPMPEILGKPGIYFDPDQPAEIAKALRTLIADPQLREECAWSAYRRACHYSWERCAEETLSFICAVAGQRRVGWSQ